MLIPAITVTEQQLLHFCIMEVDFSTFFVSKNFFVVTIAAYFNFSQNFTDAPCIEFAPISFYIFIEVKLGHLLTAPAKNKMFVTFLSQPMQHNRPWHFDLPDTGVTNKTNNGSFPCRCARVRAKLLCTLHYVISHTCAFLSMTGQIVMCEWGVFCGFCSQKILCGIFAYYCMGHQFLIIGHHKCEIMDLVICAICSDSDVWSMLAVGNT